MMHDEDTRPPLPGSGYMEDYTTPFLVVAAVLLYVALVTAWIFLGLPAVIACTYLADRMLR